MSTFKISYGKRRRKKDNCNTINRCKKQGLFCQSGALCPYGWGTGWQFLFSDTGIDPGEADPKDHENLLSSGPLFRCIAEGQEES